MDKFLKVYKNMILENNNIEDIEDTEDIEENKIISQIAIASDKHDQYKEILKKLSDNNMLKYWENYVGQVFDYVKNVRLVMPNSNETFEEIVDTMKYIF